ncbi:MAG: FAD-dependent thymidylate synthase [Thermostichales cyanobacterium DRC_bins_46]
MDPLFQVTVLNQTPDPERVIYQAMHQDYSSEYITPGSKIPSHYGEVVVKALLEGNRGHYGPLEHPQINLAVGYFPHTVMQQARTHRIGVTFDVQSFRYTGERIAELGSQLLQDPDLDPVKQQERISQVFYLPETVLRGEAKSRDGLVSIAPEAIGLILEQYRSQAITYYRLVHEYQVPYEDARSIIGYGIRQHFVVSFNCRSLMHFLDLRAKADAQLAIRHLCELILPHFQAWCPHIAQWYVKNRWGKARLAP